MKAELVWRDYVGKLVMYPVYKGGRLLSPVYNSGRLLSPAYIYKLSLQFQATTASSSVLHTQYY